MATTRLNFSSRFAASETLAVCVLIAGVPVVLVPSGLAPTSTAVSSGTVDPLWWPGVGALEYDLPASSNISLVKPWLDASAVWERYASSDPIKGDVQMEPLSFDLHDEAGAATALVSAAHARIAQLLASTVVAADGTIPLVSTAGIPSSGAAWIGREALIYDAVSGGALQITTPPSLRGAFGSRARGHRYDPIKPPLVVVGAGPRYWYGRTASVWICRVDGAVLYDPYLYFLGAIGPGIQRTANNTRWSIPLESCSETLSRKLSSRTVTFVGIAHMDDWGDAGFSASRSPLWSGDFRLTGNTAVAENRDGWHETWGRFVEDFNVVTSGVPQAVVSDGRLRVVLETGADVSVIASWNVPVVSSAPSNASSRATWVSAAEPPSTVYQLDGRIPLPVDGDAAKIPTTTSFGFGGAAAYIALTVEKTAHSDEPRTAYITGTGTNGAVDYVDLQLVLTGAETWSLDRVNALITERTTATIGVVALGNAIEALQAASLALDELDGGMHEVAIDWDQIGRLVASIPLGGLPSRRMYLFGGDEDTILSRLSHELRLRGMALCTRYGRLAAYRTGSFAATEETTATIVTSDCLTDDAGLPIEPEVIDSLQPIATSVLFTLPEGGGTYQWVDATAQSEFGDGAEVECRALEWVYPETDLSGVATGIQQTAMQLLGVLAIPYRTIRVTLGPRFLGLQEGDLVVFTHTRVPSLLGTIGITEQVCQVEQVRSQVFGGKGRAVVSLRAQDSDIAGYAPEAMVAAGGLSVGGGLTTVTVDAAVFGAAGFARQYTPGGVASTNALDGFTVGDYVVLSELNNRTPAADEAGTIVSMNTSTNTMVLSFAASAGMQTAATSAYGCTVRFDDWATVDAVTAVVRDRQELYLYIADDSDDLLGTADSPKRWAA